jgi:hypothetical protein
LGRKKNTASIENKKAHDLVRKQRDELLSWGHQEKPLAGQDAFSFFDSNKCFEGASDDGGNIVDSSGIVDHLERLDSDNSNHSSFVDSPFTVLIDSREQHPYSFQGILSDFKDDRRPINVKTERRGLYVADYAIKELDGIAIERKSLDDLVGSLATVPKRENFEGRLIKIAETLSYGAIVVECNSSDLFIPGSFKHSLLNPKTIYRTYLSWSQRYPIVHWFFCQDRDFAEQTTYRILEKFWDHNRAKDDKRNVGSVIDNHISAYKFGLISRQGGRIGIYPFQKSNPLIKSFDKGWRFCSEYFFSADYGKIFLHDQEEKYDKERRREYKQKGTTQESEKSADQTLTEIASSFSNV